MQDEREVFPPLCVCVPEKESDCPSPIPPVPAVRAGSAGTVGGGATFFLLLQPLADSWWPRPAGFRRSHRQTSIRGDEKERWHLESLRSHSGRLLLFIFTLCAACRLGRTFSWLSHFLSGPLDSDDALKRGLKQRWSCKIEPCQWLLFLKTVKAASLCLILTITMSLFAFSEKMLAFILSS